MPQYKVTDPQSGRTVTLTGDSPPTEQELEQIFASLPQAAPAHKVAEVPQETRSWTDTAVDALPALGGAVGGIIGGIGGTVAGFGVGGVPGALGGAAVDGAGGEGFKKAINYLRGKEELPRAQNLSDTITGNTPRSTMDDVKDIVGEGAKQAAFEALGLGVGKFVLKPAARHITQRVFTPAAKTIRSSPTVVDDIMEYGVGHSRKGALKARGLTNQSRKAADTMVTDLEATGTKLPRIAIEDALFTNPKGAGKAAFEIASESATPSTGLKQVERAWDDIINSNPKMLAPTRVQEIMRRAGKDGRAVFEGAENPAVLRQIQADIHTGAQHSLDTAIPGFAKQNAETAKRLAVQSTVEKALERAASSPQRLSSMDRSILWRMGLGGGGFVLGGPAGAGAMLAAHQVVRQPRIASGIARGMWQTAKSPAIQNVSRVAGVTFDEAQAGDAMQTRNREALKKSKIDALYQKYNGGVE